MRLAASWQIAAHLMALLANCHRDPKRRAKPFAPKDFDAFAQQETAEKKPRKHKSERDQFIKLCLAVYGGKKKPCSKSRAAHSP